MNFNRSNFHKNTFCIFKHSEMPLRAPDFISKSGSRYWFSDEGLFRTSNHWGRAARCKWRLTGGGSGGSRTKTGYARWSDFGRDNDTEKLYFIQLENGKAEYFHRSHSKNGLDYLRTAGDTVKRLRQLRAFLKEMDASDASDLEVLQLLITTDHPIWKIRSIVSKTPL